MKETIIKTSEETLKTSRRLKNNLRQIEEDDDRPVSTVGSRVKVSCASDPANTSITRMELFNNLKRPELVEIAHRQQVGIRPRLEVWRRNHEPRISRHAECESERLE